MFGPDKCGATNKVHFIYRHKNPVTGKYTEHHLKDAVSTVADKETHLYGFTINAANDLEIFVDGYSKRTAQLGSAKDFDPPLLPEAEIDDPEDKKPEDWVDEVSHGFSLPLSLFSSLSLFFSVSYHT